MTSLNTHFLDKSFDIKKSKLI